MSIQRLLAEWNNVSVERRNAILEELFEVQSQAELLAIRAHWELEHPEVCADYLVNEWYQAALLRAKDLPELIGEPQVLEVVEAPRLRAVRVANRYRLVSTNVDWSTKPQVHAIMAVIAAHVAIGEVVEESSIIEMLEANREVVNTRQPMQKLWAYYKGFTAEGLLMHGNIEAV